MVLIRPTASSENQSNGLDRTYEVPHYVLLTGAKQATRMLELQGLLSIGLKWNRLAHQIVLAHACTAAGADFLLVMSRLLCCWTLLTRCWSLLACQKLAAAMSMLPSNVQAASLLS